MIQHFNMSQIGSFCNLIKWFLLYIYFALYLFNILFLTDFFLFSKILIIFHRRGTNKFTSTKKKQFNVQKHEATTFDAYSFCISLPIEIFFYCKVLINNHNNQELTLQYIVISNLKTYIFLV